MGKFQYFADFLEGVTTLENTLMTNDQRYYSRYRQFKGTACCQKTPSYVNSIQLQYRHYNYC